MGAIGFSVNIEKTREDAQPLLELHERIWGWIEGQIRYLCKRQANSMVLAEYLGDTAYDGLQDDGRRATWERDERRLSFWFSDAAGCCGASSEASLHWARLAFAYHRPAMDVMTGPMGWQVTGPDDSWIDLLLRGPSWPIVYVKRGMFFASLRGPGQALEDREDLLWADESIRRPRFTDLTERERVIVEWASMTGLCQCDVCTKLGKQAQTYLKPADGIVALRNAWHVLDHDTAAAGVEASACTALKAFDSWASQPAGPAELLVLGDLLEEGGGRLPTMALAGLVESRGRMRERATDRAGAQILLVAAAAGPTPTAAPFSRRAWRAARSGDRRRSRAGSSGPSPSAASPAPRRHLRA